MSEAQVENIQKSAGKSLQEVRLAHELSIDEIAEQTRLDPRFIIALENDDYDVLPSATYARGYLRSYAKVLSLDADSIIALYNEQAPEPPEIIPHVKHSTQISSNDKPVKAFTYLITFILVLLLLAWAQSRFIVREEPLTPTVSFVEEDSNISQTSVEDNPQPYIEPLNAYDIEDQEGSILTDSSFTGVSETDTNQSIEDTRAILSLENIENEFNESIEALDDDNEQGNSDSVSEDVLQNPTAENEDDVVYSGPDEISIKLTADSWIEIYDSLDQKIYMDLGRSGEVLAFSGTAPFNIKLGFSQGVTLEFNGESIDPAPYSVAGVARFTIGE